MWDSGRVGARQCSWSCSPGRRRADPGQLVGASQGQGDIPAFPNNSPLPGRFGLPVGGWKNYLRSSADVARPRFIGRTIFPAEACRLERSAHARGQTQTAGHSISRLGAQRNPASRAKADRARGRFAISARSVTLELNLKPPPNKIGRIQPQQSSPASPSFAPAVWLRDLP
jgi:hypothetical protein